MICRGVVRSAHNSGIHSSGRSCSQGMALSHGNTQDTLTKATVYHAPSRRKSLLMREPEPVHDDGVVDLGSCARTSNMLTSPFHDALCI